MKYIEELTPGETFSFEDSKFVLTVDFKKNGSRLAYSLIDGSPKWIASDNIVYVEPVYILDENQNICPIFNYQKEENNAENT